MSSLKIFLLGPPHIELEDAAIEIKRRRALALLAYLAIIGERQPRNSLATLFWPENDQSSARKALRRDLSELNLALKGQWIDTDRESVALSPGYWLDVAEFQEHLSTSTEGSHDGVQPLTDAATLYRDDFLTGFTLSDSPAFDEWQFFQTESLRQAFASGLEQLVKLLNDQSDYEAAVPYARRWLALDPLHEPAHCRLMQLYAQAGQQAAALRQYQVCVDLLDAELGVPPDPETTTLYESIRAGDLSKQTEHRDDKLSPVPLHPVEDHKLAQSRELSGRKVSKIVNRHNLPAQTTTFIGRENELAEIVKLLDEPGCRLLNLIGPGGIGKTRLALAVATQIHNAFPDGAAFVSLAPVSEVEFIVPAFAEALGFTFYGQSDPKDQLLAYLSQKELLLVVDNFEHLLDGADLLVDIIHQAPAVALLTTSRERLNLQEEWIYEVLGLTFPTTDDKTSSALSEYSAVELFTQRARQIATNFLPSATEMADIGRICRLVEGMPLGLELAAPWVRILSCGEIAVEIEKSIDLFSTTKYNVPARHRSLQAVIDHSWQMLTADEQRLGAYCSIFRGGFTRAAATQVVGATLPMLAALADKSLLRREATGRYTIHELTRQFAQKKFQAFAKADSRSIHQAHSHYYLRLVHAQEPKLFGSEPRQAKTILRADLENVHLAWQWACANRQTEILVEALEPLVRFYKLASQLRTAEQLFASTVAQIEAWMLPDEQERYLYGQIFYYRAEVVHLLTRYQEASELADAVYAYGLAESAPALQAQAQILLGRVAYREGRLDAARQCFIEGHAYALDVNNNRLLAHALDNLGNIVHVLKEQDYGLAHHEQACEIAREQGDLWALATYLSNLGWMYYDKWEFEAALDYFQQALALQQKLNARYDMIETHLRIGQVYHFTYEDELALQQHKQAVSLTEELGLKDNSQAWLAIGKTYGRIGDWDRALHWLEKARQLLAELGKYSMLAECSSNIGAIFAGRGEYDLACTRHRDALETYRQLNMFVSMGRQHFHLGTVYRQMGNYQRARKHLDKAVVQAQRGADHIFMPQILQESGILAFSMKEYAHARSYCEQCLTLLQEMDVKHFFRKAEVTLGANILQAKLVHIDGDPKQAIHQLKTMLSVTAEPLERAAIHYARWQLDWNDESRRQALSLYQQAYDQKPYFLYQQRINRLGESH